LLVISILEVEEALERATVIAVMTSVPVSVWNVKASDEVAVPPGARMILGVVDPVVIVVTAADAWDAEKEMRVRKITDNKALRLELEEKITDDRPLRLQTIRNTLCIIFDRKRKRCAKVVLHEPKKIITFVLTSIVFI
jgi:hypothetical protein